MPIRVNSRAERAYSAALMRAAATSLTDVSVTDSWYYALIATILCTEVEGTPIREVPGTSR